jgi:hypothetical protein
MAPSPQNKKEAPKGRHTPAQSIALEMNKQLRPQALKEAV